MKRSETIFSVLLVPVDYCFVVLAGFTAYNLRFSTFSEAIPVVYELTLADFLRILLPAAIGFLIVYAIAGLYSIRFVSRLRGEWGKIFLATSAAVAIFIFVIFFRQELFASRFIILATWVLAMLYVGIGRTTVRFIQMTLLRRGIGARHLVLITPQDDKHQLKHIFGSQPEYGYVIVMHAHDASEEVRNKIAMLNKEGNVDDVLVAHPAMSQEELLALVELCNIEHIVFRYSADLLPVPLTHFEQSTLAGVPVIELKRTKLEGWGRIWKRIFDIVLSIIIFLVTSPFFIFATIGVKQSSKGPVFVKLTRVGEHGKTFTFYKFRSMIVDAEKMKQELLKYNERKDGPLFKLKEDPRVTRFGSLIRKTSIDELPQLWNVLKGDMSLVGPRPHEPQEVAQYTIPQKKLLTIKPGLTGMAQISGRSDLRFAEEAQLDIYYIENWSLMLDIRILLKTPQVVLLRKGST